jgi:tetratricopeptide (TPR) repeat protein
MPMSSFHRYGACAALCAVLVLVAWAYWPGLDGPFLFDDYGNLNALGAYGRVGSWQTFLFYITSGTADPTGRPVALLTFLLDAQAWPAAPWPFKRTNLVLHLLNTALLALVVARLQAGLQRRRRALPTSALTPALGAGLCGAHPFFVSTTLYVVQREAMLPMTFVMLALLAWDRAVHHFEHQRAGTAWAWAVIGLGGATLLGGFSKANGLLAPMLVGLAYVFYVRAASSPGETGAQDAARRPMDKAALLCLALPSALVAGYLVKVGWQLWSEPVLTGRDWTLPERLLSEPRALWSYVWRLALPRAGGGGVYVDDFAASHGWLQPMTTLPALLALLASAGAAFALRKRFPIMGFAWLFFLAAHLLESSTVPLELYFEHRNYLPAAFLGWPLAHALLRPAAYPRARAALAVVLMGGLLLLTHQRALVWGNEALLNALSGQHQQDSARSQISAARDQIERGDVSMGLARIHSMQQRHPASVDIAINAIGFECEATGRVAAETLARARYALAHATRWNYGLYEWMQGAARDDTLRRCAGFGLPGLKALVASAAINPQNAAASRKRDLFHVRGRIALAEGRPELALRQFDAALLLKPDPEYALVQAAALGDAGAQVLGVQHLDHYARIERRSPSAHAPGMPLVHAWLLRHYGYYQRELATLRRRLLSDRDTTPLPAPDSK